LCLDFVRCVISQITNKVYLIRCKVIDFYVQTFKFYKLFCRCLHISVDGNDAFISRQFFSSPFVARCLSLKINNAVHGFDNISLSNWLLNLTMQRRLIFEMCETSLNDSINLVGSIYMLLGTLRDEAIKVRFVFLFMRLLAGLQLFLYLMFSNIFLLRSLTLLHVLKLLFTIVTYLFLNMRFQEKLNLVIMTLVINNF
jgi:hypothetical protein